MYVKAMGYAAQQRLHHRPLVHLVHFRLNRIDNFLKSYNKERQLEDDKESKKEKEGINVAKREREQSRSEK